MEKRWVEKLRRERIEKEGGIVKVGAREIKKESVCSVCNVCE